MHKKTKRTTHLQSNNHTYALLQLQRNTYNDIEASCMHFICMCFIFKFLFMYRYVC